MHDRLVVVGASAAGVSAAAAARSSGYQGEIVLVGDEPHHPYERPPLSKALFDDGELLVPLMDEDYYRQNDIQLLLGSTAVALDADAQTVVLADGTRLTADAMLLATGAQPRRLGCPGADFEHIGYLRSMDDAQRIRSWLDQGGPLVVIGGGFIGLELAASAVVHGSQVTVVEQQQEVLLAPLGAAAGNIFRRVHLEAGAQIITGHEVTAIRGDRDVEAVELSNGEMIPAAAVVVGIGVVPNIGLVEHLGLSSNGVRVNEFGQSGQPWIYAAGDVAEQPVAFNGEWARIEHWNTAMSLGATAGASMAGVMVAHTEVPYFWSDQYDLKIQVFGRTNPTAQVIVRGSIAERDFALCWVNGSTVSAVAAVNRPADARGGRSLIGNRTIVDLDDLRDAADLRRLSTKR